MLSAAEDPQEFDLTPGLEAKVVDDSYKLSFVANTEWASLLLPLFCSVLTRASRDFLHRRRPATDPADAPAVPVAQRRQQRFHQWLETATARNADGDVSMEEAA